MVDDYKVIVETDDISARAIDHDLFRVFITDNFARVVSVAHSHGLDLLSIYLIKATDCAPSDSVE